MRVTGKKSSFSLLLMLGWFGLASCVTVHPGYMGYPVGEQEESNINKQTPHGMKVSCQLDDIMSDDRFKLLNVTIENTTADWIKVPEVSIAFRRSDLNNRIGIPAGQDLVQWYEATVEKRRIEAQNRAAILGALFLAGAVVGAVGDSSEHRTGQAIGAVGHLVEAGALTTAIIQDAQQQEGEMLRARMYPENHLLRGEVNIPPELFVRKYIVFQFKGEDIRKRDLFLLDFRHKDGAVETVALPITCGE